MKVFAVVDDHTLEAIRIFSTREGAEAFLADAQVVFDAHQAWLNDEANDYLPFTAPAGYDENLVGLYLSPEPIEYEVF
jgi:hypothetical protein